MIKIYKTPAEIIEACTLALKNRLYVSGWQLSRRLVEARRTAALEKAYGRLFSNFKIALKFIHGVPVAISLHDPMYHPTVMAFCAVAHRRNGYAAGCVNALQLDGKFTASIGLEHSRSLWKKFGISRFAI